MPNLRDNPTQPGNLDPIFPETHGRKRLRILSPNVALQSASPPQESHGTVTKHLEDNYVAAESHECGNFEHDCPVFQAAKSRLMTARVYCPFCQLRNDGQCSHFDHRCLGRPSLKFCRMCYKYGEHWADQCPNVVGKGPLPPRMYCRTCYSREHRTSQCPNAALQSASPPQESHGTATKHLEDNYVADESHECGNFEHDCPVFQAAKSRLMTARVYCPFCQLRNDGQCSHFDHRCLGRPSLKFCRMCYKYGEHWADQCPNVVGKGPLPTRMYCRTCYSREHRTSQCPNAVL